jgi:hypothetical protein
MIRLSQAGLGRGRRAVARGLVLGPSGPVPCKCLISRKTDLKSRFSAPLARRTIKHLPGVCRYVDTCSHQFSHYRYITFALPLRPIGNSVSTGAYLPTARVSWTGYRVLSCCWVWLRGDPPHPHHARGAYPPRGGSTFHVASATGGNAACLRFPFEGVRGRWRALLASATGLRTPLGSTARKGASGLPGVSLERTGRAEQQPQRTPSGQPDASSGNCPGARR